MPEQRYLVTARKYRPQRFGELVAQEHVTETLQNAIRLDRLAHAYLFSGPRGVGKTTAARILAKAINCTTELAAHGDAEPCRQCDSCRSFEEGRSLNIIEIDAASNNKVEDIRELRETVRIPPQGSRKKVYIIDEVHMLSNAAFNALLKTLEEPPPHVLFIFATTEPHKVLPTILSRCQRFDFRRIAVPEIVARLEEICREEAITADEASLLLIARKGDGALRDALSTFDQAVSLCGTELQYAELAQAMGVVDVDLFFEVTQHVTDRSSAGMLRLVERITRAGYDLQEFLIGLAEHLRNLLVARTMPDTDLIEATGPTRQRYAEASRHFAETDLLRLLMIAAETEESIKSSTQPRLKLETALLKMASLSHTVDLRQALRQIEQLEALAREGALPAAPAAGAPPVSSTPSPEAPSGSAGTPGPVEPAPRPPASTPAPQPRPEPPAASGAEAAEEALPTPSPEPPPPPAEQTGPPRPGTGAAQHQPAAPPAARASREAEEQTAAAPPPEPPRPYPNLFGPPALSKKKSPPTPPPTGRTNEPQPLRAAAAVPDTPAEASPLQHMAASWPRYVQTIKAERIHVGSLLQQGTPVEVRSGTLVVAVPDTFHQRLLDNQHDFLLEHLARICGDGVSRLQFTVREAVQARTPAEAAPEVDPHEYMLRKRQESPVIRAIFDQFGGELVW